MSIDPPQIIQKAFFMVYQWHNNKLSSLDYQSKENNSRLWFSFHWIVLHRSSKSTVTWHFRDLSVISTHHHLDYQIKTNNSQYSLNVWSSTDQLHLRLMMGHVSQLLNNLISSTFHLSGKIYTVEPIIELVISVFTVLPVCTILLCALFN